MLKESILAALILLLLGTDARAGEKVLTSIPPVQFLVAAVMQGVNQPGVLVGGGVSPHSYAMKPSDARKIAESELVFMISPQFETFMAKPISAKADVIYLADTVGIKLLPMRGGYVYEHSDEHELTNGYDKVFYDFHIWLSYDNAIQMIRKIADTLMVKDKKNAAVYAKNANAEMDRIKALARETVEDLQYFKDKYFLVYHDAGQYFEEQNSLNNAGVIMVHEGVPVSVRQRVVLEHKIKEQGIKCLLVEPWENNEKTEKLAKDMRLSVVVFNPLNSVSSQENPSKDSYVNMMRDVVKAYKTCLAQ